MGRANVIVLFFRHVTRTGRCSALLVPHFQDDTLFFSPIRLRSRCQVLFAPKFRSLRSTRYNPMPPSPRPFSRFSFFHEPPYDPTIYIRTPHITSQHTRYRKITLVGEEFYTVNVHSFYCFISTFGMVWLGDSLRGLYYWVLVSLAPWLALSPAKTFPSTQFNAIRTYAYTHFPLFCTCIFCNLRDRISFSLLRINPYFFPSFLQWTLNCFKCVFFFLLTFFLSIFLFT